MGKKKSSTYLTVTAEQAARLQHFGFVTLGTAVPANRAARRATKKKLKLSSTPGPVAMPSKRKEV